MPVTVPRVLLLATTTGYQIRSFGHAAEAVGVRLLFGSDRCDRLEDPWWDQAIPIRFYDEAASVDALVSGVGAEGVSGVVAVGDTPTMVAALVNARLGLPGHAPGAVATARNKLEVRRALRDAGLLVPAFCYVGIDTDPSEAATAAVYPAVVKPLALSGSRGVIRVNDQRECIAAIERVRLLLLSADVRRERNPAHDSLVIESFIPGEEFAVEGLMSEGVLRVLAVFDKPDPLDGPFFEETIYVTPSRAEPARQMAIVVAVARACAALGLTHGPVHAECRVNGNGVFVLEVAPRPIGGLCARALRFYRPGAPSDASSTCSLEELLLRHAMGEDVTGCEREPDGSAVMMIPIPKRGVFRRVDGVEAARAVDGIEDVAIVAKPDSLLVPLPEGKSYLGFIFARGATAADAEQAVRAAHSQLRFAIEREIALVG